MSKSLKSIEEQKQDIVKYTSIFKGVHINYKDIKQAFVVACPDQLTHDVLEQLLKNQGYEPEHIINFPFTFRIKLLSPAIDSEALVAMMREYVATLDDKEPIGLLKTEKDHAARTFIHFLVAIGVQGKDL